MIKPQIPDIWLLRRQVFVMEIDEGDMTDTISFYRMKIGPPFMKWHPFPILFRQKGDLSYIFPLSLKRGGLSYISSENRGSFLYLLTEKKGVYPGEPTRTPFQWESPPSGLGVADLRLKVRADPCFYLMRNPH